MTGYPGDNAAEGGIPAPAMVPNIDGSLSLSRHARRDIGLSAVTNASPPPTNGSSSTPGEVGIRVTEHAQRRSSRQTERSARPAWLAAEFGSGRRWHPFGGAIESTAELHSAPTITDVMKEHHRVLRVARCRRYPGSCPISGTTDGVEGERLNNRMPVPELCSWMQDFRCRRRTMRCGCTRTSSGRGRGSSALCGTARGRRAGLIRTGAVLRAAVRATAYQCDGNHAPRRYCDEPGHTDLLFGLLDV